MLQNKGDLEKVKELIEKGADVNYINHSETSQLGWACEKGNFRG